MCNVAALNVQIEAVAVSLFSSPVPALLSVVVDMAVKPSNAHERQTCLFRSLAGLYCGDERAVLIFLEYLFTCAKNGRVGVGERRWRTEMERV